MFWGVFWGCRLGKFCQEHTWQGCSGMRVWRPWIRVSPGWTEHIWQPSAIENFVEYYMLGQLTWQWMGLDIKEIRRRQRRLRERWESVGPFKIWFDGWRLLDGRGRVYVLEKTLAFDRQFGLAMLQAVYLFQTGSLQSMDLRSSWSAPFEAHCTWARAQRRPPSQDILQALGSCLEP